jgi:hypothetical protein
MLQMIDAKHGNGVKQGSPGDNTGCTNFKERKYEAVLNAKLLPLLHSFHSETTGQSTRHQLSRLPEVM